MHYLQILILLGSASKFSDTQISKYDSILNYITFLGIQMLMKHTMIKDRILDHSELHKNPYIIYIHIFML